MLKIARDFYSIHNKRLTLSCSNRISKGSVVHFLPGKNIMIRRNWPLLRSITELTNITVSYISISKIKYSILSACYLFHLKSQVREKHFTLKTDKILERTKEVLLITLQHLKFMAKLTRYFIQSISIKSSSKFVQRDTFLNPKTTKSALGKFREKV